MDSLIDHVGVELKLVGHTDQALQRAWHAAAAIVPSKLVLAGPDKIFKNVVPYLVPKMESNAYKSLSLYLVSLPI